MNKDYAKALQNFKNSKNLPDEIKFIKTFPDGCNCTEVSDGFLNQVFAVTDEKAPSIGVVVKRAPPYMNVLGPDYPLSPERASFEYKSLCIYNNMCPGSVPKPYGYDDESKTVILEYLHDFKSMKTQVLEDRLDVPAVASLARALGKVHSNHHLKKVGQEKIKELDTQFCNSDMVSLALDFFFTRPYSKDSTTNVILPELKQTAEKVYQDDQLLACVREMKQLYEAKKETLIHGDFTFSSLLTKEGVSKIIDHEFARVGPASFDVGVFIAHCLMSYHLHLMCPNNNTVHRNLAYKFMDACRSFVNIYIDEFEDIIPKSDEYWTNFMSEVAGYAACEIMSRVIGGPKPLPVDHIAGVEAAAMDTAIRLLRSKARLPNIDRLLFIGLQLC